MCHLESEVKQMLTFQIQIWSKSNLIFDIQICQFSIVAREFWLEFLSKYISKIFEVEMHLLFLNEDRKISILCYCLVCSVDVHAYEC